MITEKDLNSAIAECQGIRNPKSDTCIKLAAFLIIKEHLYPDQEKDPVQVQEYSYAEPPGEIMYNSGSEFSDMIQGKDQEQVMQVIDELMDVLHATNPRLYNAVLQKLD